MRMNACWVLVLPFLISAVVVGQVPDLSQMTLDFVDVTKERISSEILESLDGNEKDIVFGDYDNDGDLDVAIANAHSDFGQRRNKLYRNEDGVLNEVSGTDVIPEFSLTDVARTALFEDFDQDGFLDLIIVCDSNSGTNQPDSPGRTKYYRNVEGDYFVNETERLNFLSGAAAFAAVADFDNNGFLDFVMSNHPLVVQDVIAFNQIDGNGPGEFSNLTSTHIPADTEYGKHVETADMNGDGKIDILMASAASNESFIYYNDNGKGSSGPGDFRHQSPGAATLYPGGSGGLAERALVPGDFNNDGKMDFYFANAGEDGMGLSDAIYVNVGNDKNNKAVFIPQPISSLLNDETIKIAVVDLDLDRRDDLIVMADFRRPYIFRNTSENGSVSFLEWTPANLNLIHQGWNADAADLTGDSRPDIFVGAAANDFLFEGRVSRVLTTSDLAGGTDLPEIDDDSPIAVSARATFGETRIIRAPDLDPGTSVSVLLRSLGDFNLTVKSGEQIVAVADRAGYRVDEALQFTVPAAGEIQFEIAVDQLSFDGNGDGVVDLLDIDPFVGCLTGANSNCDPFDVNDNGDINLLLIQPFLEKLINSKNSEEFLIEFLSRFD